VKGWHFSSSNSFSRERAIFAKSQSNRIKLLPLYRLAPRWGE
jgi:hypothetical protein